MSELTLSANYHQGDTVFNDASRGRQCTSNCLIAIVYHNICKQVTTWNSTDLDIILFKGDELYMSIKSSLPTGVEYLSVDDLPEYLQVNNNFDTAHISIKQSYTGDIFTTEAEYPYYTLQNALTEAFDISDTCFFIAASEMSGSTVALLCTHNKYFVFDSHARNQHTALPDIDGLCTLSMHVSISDLCIFLQQLFQNEKIACNFELVPAEIKSVGCSTNPTDVLCDPMSCSNSSIISPLVSSPQEQSANSTAGIQSCDDIEKMTLPRAKGMLQHIPRTQTNNNNNNDYTTNKAAKRRAQYKRRIENESSMEKAERLKKKRETNKANKQNETNDQKAQRLEKERLRKRSKRQQLTNEQHKQTLEQDRLRKRSKRQQLTNEQHKQTLEQDRLRKRSKRQQLTNEQHKQTLEQDRLRKRSKRQQLTNEQHKQTLEQDRLRKRSKRQQLTNEQHKQTLEQDRLRKRSKRQQLTNEQHKQTLEQDQLRKRSKRQQETDEQHKKRLQKDQLSKTSKKQAETHDQKMQRIEKQRLNRKAKTLHETPDERHQRLRKCCDYQRRATAKKYVKEHSTTFTDYTSEQYKSEYPAFHCYIQQQPKYYCIICKKLLFHDQVQNCSNNTIADTIVNQSDNSGQYFLCSKCSTFLDKQKPIPNAWSNNMDPGDIPLCLKQLTRMETRLVSLKYTFIKLIVLPGGQYGEQGQAISFPTNIETSCQLLPRSQDTAGLVIVHPSQTDKTQIQSTDPQHIVRFSKMHEALTWLIEHNHLYSHVNIATFADWAEHSSEFNPVATDHDETDLSSVPSDVQELSSFPCNYINPDIDLQSLLQGTIDNVPAISLPRETSTPQSIFKETDLEEHCFPQLYPYGKNGFKQTRDVSLTDLQYFQSRLLNINDRWRKNIPWLFFALNSYEIKKLYNQISIVCRIQKQGNVTSQSLAQPVTAGDFHQQINEDVQSTSYTFMKNIRGTAGYFKDQLLNLLAKINTIGPPTWFVTMSANDLNWPELFMTLNPDLTYEQAKVLPQQVKWNLMRSDPVMCAIHFNRRTDAVLRFILNSHNHPIGVITDHWIRVEFQLRGSPHLHCMFWVENAPDLDTIEGRQSAPAFIDKYISTQLPDDQNSLLYQLVSKYQTHHHTSTCKKRRVNCRFYFPREVSDTTRLRLDVDPNRSAQFYVTKRAQRDIWINAFNPTLLMHMQSNMDIQMVGSKYGAAYYACMYISKAEPENLRRAISTALSTLPPQSTKRQRLAQIGNTVLSHRLVSAQEVGYRLANLPLIRSSRQTLSINTRPPESRMRLLKPRDELAQLDNASTDIFIKGTAQYYAMRPHGEIWDKMSLYTFAASYSMISTEPSSSCESFKLQECDKWIKKRSKYACVRGTRLSSGNGDDYFYGLLYLYCPWRDENDILHGYTSAQDAFIAKKNLFDYSIAQHVHFTSEIEQAIMQVRLLSNDLSSIADTLAPNVTHQQLQTYHDFDTADLYLDPHWTSQNAHQATAATQTTTAHDVDNISENLTIVHDDSLAWNTLTSNTMTDDAFYQALTNMSHDQQQVFNTIKEHFTELQKHHANQGNPKPQPLRLLVTSGAGCGKSFLIKVLNEYLIRISNHPTSPVILTAPTGVAAFNIGGSTVHSALSLPVDHTQRGKTKYLPLGAEKLSQLRRKFNNIHTIFIDEISMISNDRLEHIHLRLSEIKDTTADQHSYFGNLNIIVFGDFFQLKPVFGKFIFEDSQNHQEPFPHLWRSFFKPLFLTINHRQENDKQYTELLNRVRLGLPSSADIKLLESRLMTKSDIEQSPFSSALHIFPTRKQAAEYNKEELERLHLQTNTQVHILKANDEMIDGPVNTKSIPADDLISANTSETAGLEKNLHLAQGCRVMLLRNILSEDGLVNGAQGTVEEFLFQSSATNEQSNVNEQVITGVYVKFDNPKVGQTIQDPSKNNAILISPITARFFAHYSTVFTRTQYPLQLSYGSTVHKVQGLSLTKAVLDIGHKVFSPGQTYVALSRVTSLEGLALLAFEPKRISVFQSVIKEMTRLTESVEQNKQPQQSKDT
ncbi:uncharacterized protein LOC118415349 [Branchiostoma floridae]|uniref:ATP-dependent DNA helicase n=1 Tax=Branchiostoma floridae TaxID=7739 RepID=A0A9J7MPI8_BRAFL|nr:uncharacterized protein LOC118415349 [Branchiostoma floridae]